MERQAEAQINFHIPLCVLFEKWIVNTMTKHYPEAG